MAEQRETVDAVLKFYGHREAQWLRDLLCGEKPWLDARTGLALTERGAAEITYASMREYYASLEQ